MIHFLKRYQASLSDFILGSQDGLVNVLGVILGVAAATSSHRVIIAAGLAATFAESISMGAVAYTSFLADCQLYESKYQKEKKAILETPDKEKEEVREIYRAKGFEGDLLEQIVEKITSNESVWLSTMMRDELNMETKFKSQAVKSAVIVFVAAFIGSIIPLLPFVFLEVKLAVVVSVIACAWTLYQIGWYKAKMTVGSPLKNGLEMASIGIVSALAGYGIGLLFSTV